MRARLVRGDARRARARSCRRSSPTRPALEGGNASRDAGRARHKAPPLLAALVNGTASHALDYDDVHLSYIGHPTVAVLPAILALGEQLGASRRATSSPPSSRATRRSAGSAWRWRPGHYALGFHATATAGSFGAAAACARLMGLDPAKTAMALGIAATEAAGLKSMFGTMCKPLHAGKAAQNGLLAARLAARGFTSRPDAIECAQGFAATHGPDFHPEAALADPPGGFYIRGNLFKYHAACYLTHAPIECARQIAARPGFAADKVRAVSLRDRPRRRQGVQHRWCRAPGSRRNSRCASPWRWRSPGSIRRASRPTATRGRTEPRLVALRDKVEIVFEDGWPTLARDARR